MVGSGGSRHFPDDYGVLLERVGIGAGRTVNRRRLYLFAAAYRDIISGFRFGRSVETAHLSGDGVNLYRRFSGNPEAQARSYFKTLDSQPRIKNIKTIRIIRD